MKHEINNTWTEDMAFEADIFGHKIIQDASPQFGGKDKGPVPKPLLLVSLAGCTGMDVISILTKMRAQPKYFNVKISGELTKTEPMYYEKIHITYEVSDDAPLEKVEKAVNLSQEQYCGVSAMLKKAAEITYEIKTVEGK